MERRGRKEGLGGECRPRHAVGRSAARPTTQPAPGLSASRSQVTELYPSPSDRCRADMGGLCVRVTGNGQCAGWVVGLPLPRSSTLGAAGPETDGVKNRDPSPPPLRSVKARDVSAKWRAGTGVEVFGFPPTASPAGGRTKNAYGAYAPCLSKSTGAKHARRGRLTGAGPCRRARARPHGTNSAGSASRSR